MIEDDDFGHDDNGENRVSRQRGLAPSGLFTPAYLQALRLIRVGNSVGAFSGGRVDGLVGAFNGERAGALVGAFSGERAGALVGAFNGERAGALMGAFNGERIDALVGAFNGGRADSLVGAFKGGIIDRSLVGAFNGGRVDRSVGDFNGRRVFLGALVNGVISFIGGSSVVLKTKEMKQQSAKRTMSMTESGSILAVPSSMVPSSRRQRQCS
ncbi:hypothetical protein F2Q69_00017239 [Brassica cretica]|uniref:Uncharacterized protein n=1 Tax=Brassica cretica TaxID=69181 RepID=A0A8S9R950_BRACR|nr:hypothetical protein F2Q69_00017239 [Brassica cretica]